MSHAQTEWNATICGQMFCEPENPFAEKMHPTTDDQDRKPKTQDLTPKT
jgi:hypothetical protein